MTADADTGSPRFLRDRYAIVGVGETAYMRGSGVTTRALGTTAVRNASITPGDGWRLFMPFERDRERWASLLGAMWMAALLAPLGYLAAGRSAAAVGVAGAGAAAYLVLLPLALGCAWLPFAGWCGAVGGFLIGKATAPWTS